MDKLYLLEKQTNEIIIEKSRFISLLLTVNTLEEVSNYLRDIKKEFKNATHYTYATITSDGSKASDDGEPSGTAGRPLLELLKRQNITNVLLVVIRYYGGVKLGVGKLLRTYVDAGNSVIQKGKYYYKTPAKTIYIDVNANTLRYWEKFMKLNRILILKQEYNMDSVRLTLKLAKEVDVEKLFNMPYVLLSDDEYIIEYKVE